MGNASGSEGILRHGRRGISHWTLLRPRFVTTDKTVRHGGARSCFKRSVSRAGILVSLQGVRKKGPAAVLALDEGLSVPLGVGSLVVSFHHGCLFGWCQLARLDRFELL